MRLHDLKPTPGSTKKKMRDGRGIAGRRGKTAGRGTKGQGARSGGGKGLYFEGGQLPLVRRLPFKRGFTNLFRIEYQEVNLWLLERTFEDGDVVTPVVMQERGIITDSLNPIVILGGGEITKKLTITANRFTKSAQEKLEKAGCTVTKLPLRVIGSHATIRRLPKAQMEKLYGSSK